MEGRKTQGGEGSKEARQLSSAQRADADQDAHHTTRGGRAGPARGPSRAPCGSQDRQSHAAQWSSLSRNEKEGAMTTLTHCRNVRQALALGQTRMQNAGDARGRDGHTSAPWALGVWGWRTGATTLLDEQLQPEPGSPWGGGVVLAWGATQSGVQRNSPQKEALKKRSQ